MSFAATIQDRALFEYLRWMSSGTDLAVENRVRESTMLAFWHEWVFAALGTAREPGRIAVYIWHTPGMERIIQFVRRLGFEVILANKANQRGVTEVRRWLQRGDGRIVAITLDGPRGPRHVAKPGVVQLARDAGVPLRPLFIDAPVALRLPTWDGCIVPARGRVTQRPLDLVTTTGSVEDAARGMQRALDDLAPSKVAPSGVRGLPGKLWARASTLPLQVGRLQVIGAQASPVPNVKEAGRPRP